jgi:hypothetical protein
MHVKLTLRLNDHVIRRAKKFAKRNNTSLSRMIESYLDSIAGPEESEPEITSLVESLSGVIDLPDDYDYRKNYPDYLEQKYG